MNCYLTKSNPKIWKTLDYLKALDRNVPDWWSDVCKDAEPGDILFIGIAGKDAGIYAKATVISCLRWDTPDREFYVNPKDIKERLGADIDADSFRNLVLEHQPILEARLTEIPELRRVAKWLHVQGARCRLTEDEAEALNALI